jgi:hypothetical protein
MSINGKRLLSIISLAARLTAGLAFGQTPDQPAKPTVFRARFFTGGGGTMDRVLTTKIEIAGFSTKDEIQKLAEAYNAKGDAGFRETFRSFKKGKIQVIGASGLNIEFHAAMETQKEGGFQIQLIAENAQFQPGGSQKPFTGLMFLVVILDVDAKGEGEGRVYEDTGIEFTSEGELKLGAFQRAPKLLTAVKKQK